KKVLATYIGWQIGFVVLSGLVALSDNLLNLKIRVVLFLFPTCTMMLTIMDTSKEVEKLFLRGALVSIAASFVMLFIRMVRQSRETRDMEKQAREQLTDAQSVAAA